MSSQEIGDCRNNSHHRNEYGHAIPADRREGEVAHRTSKTYHIKVVQILNISCIMKTLYTSNSYLR